MLAGAFLQKDRHDPNLLVTNNVINTVEPEQVYRRPAHVRKPDAMKQR